MTTELAEKTKAALERAELALDDWLNTYAPEFCNEDRVAQAHSRISNQDGTIAYITSVRDQITDTICALEDQTP